MGQLLWTLSGGSLWSIHQETLSSGLSASHLGFCHSSMGTERKESVLEKGHQQPVAIESQETDTFSDWPLRASMHSQP